MLGVVLTHLHGQHPGGHLRGTEAPQEVVQHLTGGLLVSFGPQQQVLQTQEELTLFLLPLCVCVSKQV